ncbi:hypothetical protein JXA48_03200 [Candidatus Woesearchaeota archaeon]|nr:hypothetical protein [Candidatus Woesearchaeota archaeon]
MFEEKLPSLDKLAEKFKKELEGVTDIDELKDIYAKEVARRDQLIFRLQEQNKILLSSSIRSKQDELRN